MLQNQDVQKDKNTHFKVKNIHSFSHPLFFQEQMPHFFQQFQIVLLDTHQNETKQCQRCYRTITSPSFWSTSVPLLLGVVSRTCLVNISWELVKWLRPCSSIEEQRNQILPLLVIDTPLPHHYFWIIAGISLL